RNELYFQHWGPHEGAYGAWSAIRTDQWKYVENAYGEKELYDLLGDPFEEVSQHNNPTFSAVKDKLALKLAGKRGLGVRTHKAPNGKVGQSYSLEIDTWGGQPPFTWKVESGSLPDGLTLGSSNGVISGTPLTAGIFNAKISVEDSSVGRHSGKPQRVVGPGKNPSTDNFYKFTINP
ncbi:MAG: putative Ig domain-containing protein, partial [Arenicellales bacterium]